MRSSKRENSDALKQISNAISESRTLIAVAGVLFGFLLSVSVNSPELDEIGRLLLSFSLMLSLFTIILFSMPVIYHHLEFPYPNPQKFLKRYHWFMIMGFLPFMLTLYLASSFALYQMIGLDALWFTGVVFLLAGLVYKMRRLSSK